MPEGDTLFRVAAVLARALEGRTLDSVESAVAGLDERDLVGRRVERVESRGKNLLLWLDDDRVVWSHLRMTGSWHTYRRGERWHKSARTVRLVLRSGDREVVCFGAPVVELLRRDELRSPRVLGRLGPDLLDPRCDLDEARRRLRSRADLPIGEALLRQSSVAGIGNVYKSELLFLEGIDPRTPVARVTDAALAALLEAARDLLGRNTGGRPRRTRVADTGPRHWVYGRGGEPCCRCGETIRRIVQGDSARSTYWCPRCQS